MMAIGKNELDLNLDNLNLSFGKNKILEKGQIIKNYSETELNNYMKSDMININIEINSGKKNFTCYTMDFTKKYIEINSDYRT